MDFDASDRASLTEVFLDSTPTEIMAKSGITGRLPTPYTEIPVAWKELKLLLEEVLPLGDSLLSTTWRGEVDLSSPEITAPEEHERIMVPAIKEITRSQIGWFINSLYHEGQIDKNDLLEMGSR